ncbi:MAG: hypothetical protein ABEL51_06775 [Salinibacter sp.]
MTDLFRDADDEPGESGERSSPSVDTIVSAFRDASGRSASRGSSADEGSTGQLEAGAEGGTTSDEPSESSSSPANIVQGTLAAFRKEERRFKDEDLEGSRPEATGHGRREGRTERSEARDDAPEVEEEEEPPPEPSGDTTEEQDTNSFEDFGSAFREALSKGGRTKPKDFKDVVGGADEDDEDTTGEEDGASETLDRGTEDEPGRAEDEEIEDEESARTGEEEPPPPDAEVEPAEQRGDTVPASEKIEMSAGTSPADTPEGFPSRPAESFLWVSDRAVDDPAVVSVDQLDGSRAKEAEAFLLHGRGDAPHELLTRIRSHSSMSVYLKPVFWRHAEGQRSPVASHVDGEWTEDKRSVFRSLQGQAESINQRINNLIGIEEREEGGMELRVLRFMATRNHEFTPHRTIENSDGFVYPKLTPLLERESQSGGGELAQVLSVLEERRLLNGEFVMRQHACRNCGSAFLNFEEMCPHCGSNNIDADDLVHHFRCAFTGALSEYKKEEGKLVCPKCDRQLKQIGVDYDKPSVVHTCRRCHEQFQDPDVQTTCYQCEHTNVPEQQVERQIKEYEVTALGEETAAHGLSDSLLSILERESRVLDYATFQLIVESEAARIERYQRSTSCLLMVRISGLNQLRMELGERSEEVIEEIATAFDNTLRSSDYLSARDESLYMFLLTETDQSGARRAGERLENNIEGVLHQNLQHPPELNIAVQPVRPNIELDGLAERFLAVHTHEPAAVNG